VARHSFLQLLVEGAPAARYEEVLRAGLDDADTADGRAALLVEHRHALQLRDTLDSQRARQESQRALLECAKELADVPGDVDTILTSIVTRAQALLGCDLAYLSMNDPQRPETYVRVMVGATSSYWKDIRIPFGIGIGGKVAATAAPFATADYFSDERLDHDPAVDESARAERQSAIVGVPLVHRSHVIGVLFASNRTPGAFSHDSITLLSSFAALAAVAIDQATLLQDKERALVELHEANEALQARTRDTERAVAAHDRSMDIVLRGGGTQEVVAATGESLDGPLAIFDELHTPIAWTPGTAEAELAAMLAAAQTDEARSGRSVEVDRFLVNGLIAGAEQLGALVWAPMVPPAAVPDPDRRLLERATVVASLLQLFQRNLGAAEARVRGELLEDLLAPSPATSTSLADRAQRVGYQPQERHAVVVAHIAAPRRPRLASAAADLAAARDGLSTSRDGFAVLLLPSDDASLTARQVARSMSMRIGAEVTAGAAGPVDDPALLPGAYEEALACTRALLRLDRSGGSATAADLGYAGLLLGQTTSAADFATRTLGPVLRHDEQRSTDLLTTVETYFATGQSLATSARRLHVHPNTITQRLDRVKRLLRVDLADPDQALDLQLALRLHRILHPGAGDHRADNDRADPAGSGDHQP
jgi:PucR C-terminal helix-turn-helix domain/GAF domain/GGDEF-like domain